MTASEREEALDIFRSSCLLRRRTIAADKLDPVMSVGDLAAIVMVVLGLFTIGVLLAKPATVALRPGYPVPEVPYVSTTGTGRFCYRHTVRPRENFWLISEEYYGRGTPENIRRLQDANRNIPKDPKQLFVAKTVMVPLRDGGCD